MHTCCSLSSRTSCFAACYFDLLAQDAEAGTRACETTADCSALISTSCCRRRLLMAATLGDEVDNNSE